MVPSNKVKEKGALKGDFFEGVPKFEKYTKEINITTNPDKLKQAAIGKITIYISGTILNEGKRDLSGFRYRLRFIDKKTKWSKERNTSSSQSSKRFSAQVKILMFQYNIKGFSDGMTMQTALEICSDKIYRVSFELIKWNFFSSLCWIEETYF